MIRQISLQVDSTFDSMDSSLISSTSPSGYLVKTELKYTTFIFFLVSDDLDGFSGFIYKSLMLHEVLVLDCTYFQKFLGLDFIFG